MKNAFKEWYAPTEEDLRRLWLEGTIILDANVLLDFYLYPPETLAEFFKVLESLATRLWLPHQAALEYQKNRDKSLPQQRGVLERLIRNLEDRAHDIETLNIPEYHPLLDFPAFESNRTALRAAFQPLIENVREALSRTPEFNPQTILGSEPIRDQITNLFEDRVGNAFSVKELESIYSEGAKRFAAEQPPGYKDLSKQEPNRYADLIIWKQILTRQKSAPDGLRGAIFVTNDRKEDWWLRKNNLRLGPRPELVREYLDDVGDDFFMYTPAEFLKSAPVYLNLTVSTAAVVEVQRISETSPVADSLRARQMVLPDLRERERGLSEIFDALKTGGLRVAQDLTILIQGLGAQFGLNFVQVPLFFALISPEYGPIEVEYDQNLRLRDRAIFLPEGMAKDEFMTTAHAAWLAQALYRVRYESFSDEDFLLTFFGNDYPPEARGLVARARRFLEPREPRW